MSLVAYDAAYPPPDPHLDVCAFYIGGNTPHVWSDSEIAAQSARWRLPIFTANNAGSRDVRFDVQYCTAWFQWHKVPQGSSIALDFETTVDGNYVSMFDSLFGWHVILYGSRSSVTRNPRPSGGYWTAEWTGIPHLNPEAYMTQYASDAMLGKPYDLSMVQDASLLWDTRPSTVIPTAPVQAMRKSGGKMIIIYIEGRTDVWALNGSRLWHIQDVPSLESYLAAGIPHVTVSLAEFTAIQAA